MNHNFEANKAKAAKMMFYLIKLVRTHKRSKRHFSMDKRDLLQQIIVADSPLCTTERQHNKVNFLLGKRCVKEGVFCYKK